LQDFSRLAAVRVLRASATSLAVLGWTMQLGVMTCCFTSK
jgi:hypothetical protein